MPPLTLSLKNMYHILSVSSEMNRKQTWMMGADLCPCFMNWDLNMSPQCTGKISMDILIVS